MSNINIVNAKTTTTNFQMTSGATNGYVLTSDSNGNATWQPVSFTGNTSGDCITDLYITNLYGCSPITVNDSIQSVTSSATGTTSFAFGFQNQANGKSSVSLGNSTTASGKGSHAEGNLSVASGDYSHAQNSGCQSIGTNSFAGGNTSIASGDTSFVFSTNSTLSGNNSAILGGSNLSGTENDFVYVPSLEINGEVRELGGSNLTGDGTLTISGGVSTISVTITGTNNVTLPNGTSGQKITIYVQQNTGVNTTISGTFLGYSTVQLAAVGESVQLLFTSAGWVIIGGNNFVAT